MSDKKTMTSYISPEHKQLVDMAESSLRAYEVSLWEQLKPKSSPSIEPNHEDMLKAQKAFYKDPVRHRLVNIVMEMKLLYEKPMIIIENSK